MDGCWLYMTADTRGGDGSLSDKQVAERFFIGDLVIPLLRSARSGIDGCLEQMSAQKDRANFAGDLGTYLTQDGAYMLAHLHWLNRKKEFDDQESVRDSCEP
jgi:hypothetical protein